MKFLAVITLAAAVAVSAAPSASAATAPAVGHALHRAPEMERTWPLQRALPPLVVRRARVPIRVHAAVFLRPVVWRRVVDGAPPPPETVAWEDRESLARRDAWTELTLECNDRGSEFYLDVSEGRAEIDWVEIVFGDGRAQVVDFREGTLVPGVYDLIRLHHGRRVDHVRLVARALDRAARIELDLR